MAVAGGRRGGRSGLGGVDVTGLWHDRAGGADQIPRSLRLKCVRMSLQTAITSLERESWVK
jgi:hypothetical protein